MRAQVGIPYFYGGLAKLNGDWLRAEPIGTWIRAQTLLPVIGPVLGTEWAPFLFAYGGLLFDLLIVPALLWPRTRPFAFGVAMLFHGLNAPIFRIGVFPWLMAATTLFFLPQWPRRFGFHFRVPRQARPWRLRPSFSTGSASVALSWCAISPCRSFSRCVTGSTPAT